MIPRALGAQRTVTVQRNHRAYSWLIHYKVISFTSVQMLSKQWQHHFDPLLGPCVSEAGNVANHWPRSGAFHKVDLQAWSFIDLFWFDSWLPWLGCFTKMLIITISSDSYKSSRIVLISIRLNWPFYRVLSHICSLYKNELWECMPTVMESSPGPN